MKNKGFRHMVPAGELSNQSGYSLNAIRIKRRASGWDGFSKKIGNRIVLIDVLAFNQWCANSYPNLKLSSTEIQFILENRFVQLFGIKPTSLAGFCSAADLNYNDLVIKAPDERRMINVILFKANLERLMN